MTPSTEAGSVIFGSGVLTGTGVTPGNGVATGPPPHATSNRPLAMMGANAPRTRLRMAAATLAPAHAPSAPTKVPIRGGPSWFAQSRAVWPGQASTSSTSTSPSSSGWRPRAIGSTTSWTWPMPSRRIRAQALSDDVGRALERRDRHLIRGVAHLGRPVPPGIRTSTATVRSMSAGSRPASIAAASTFSRRGMTPAALFAVSAYHEFHARVRQRIRSIRSPLEPMRMGGPPGRRGRLQLAVARLVELPVEVDPALLEQRPHDVNASSNRATRWSNGEVERTKLGLVPARAHAEDQAAAGDLVDSAGELREHRR